VKITKVETFPYWAGWKNWLFVKVATDEGLYGWGEASLAGPIRAVETAIHELAAVLIGQDPGGVERHWQAMYHTWRWRGGPVQSSAIAGLDIALWDIEGKRLGVPVYRLLGGPYRTRLRVYASNWLLNVSAPDGAFEGAQEAVRRGFTAFKCTPLSNFRMHETEHGAISQAAALMEAARAGAGPDTEIFIDCGERLSPRTAVLAARALAPYRPGFIEEPIPFENAKAMARLKRELPIPLATGERLLSRWEYRELVEEGGADIIQPDLTHAGGITEVKRIAALADTYYLPVAPHNSAGPIGTLAAMHLCAAVPNFLTLEQFEDERVMRDSACTNPVVYADGYFHLPDRPGLGTDLVMETMLERSPQPLPIQHRTESLWH
jgi:galactonate dehydratase